MTENRERSTTNGIRKIEKENFAYDYEEILDIIGFGRVQVKMVIVCALILLMVMNELMGIGIITIASQCDLNLNEADKGIMHGVVLYGKIASSYFLGYLSDKYGRRSVLAYANLVGMCCSFATMFVTNYTVFVVFRFFIGFFTGGTVGIALAYIAEFSAAAHRPIFMNFVNIANAVSFVYVPIVAWFVLLMDWKLVLFETYVFRPWRILIFFNLLPGLIASLMVLKYPETPKFLIAFGRHKEAYDALNWVCQQNRKGQRLEELHVYEVKNTNDKNISIDQSGNGGFIKSIGIMFVETFALFKRPHVLNFVVSSLTMSGSFVISFGLAVWYPDIQNSIASYEADSLPKTVCDIIVDKNSINSTELHCNDHVSNKSLLDFLIYGAMSIVAYIILGSIINIKTRKVLLIILLSVACVCGTALVWLQNPIAIVVAFSLYIVFSDLGVSTIVGFLVDLLPTKLCGQGSCLIMTFARISGAVSTYIIGLYLSTHCVVVFEVFAAMMLICAASAYLLNPNYNKKVNDTIPS